jgi:hypothetical protein
MAKPGFRCQLSLEALESRTLLDAGLGGDDQIVHPRIINGDETDDFPSVGIVGDRFGGFCSGTLIAERWVLTAAHCAVGLSHSAGRFTLGDDTFATSRVIVHPDYNPSEFGTNRANDIALFQLNQTVPDVTPSPIFRDVPQVGDILTLVGYGAGGTGNSGHDGSFGTLRVGTTPIDRVTRTLIRWRFDNNSESNTAPGDSGGPAFLEIGGAFHVAGITSGGSRSDAAIGDRSFDTRVDAYQTWIDSFVSGGGGGGDDHGDTFESATEFSLNSRGRGQATGSIEAAFDLDVFRFVSSITGRLVIKLQAVADLDPMLEVFNARGKSIGFNDDFDGLDSRVVVDVRANRTYFAAAQGFEDSTGEYELSTRSPSRSRDSGRSAAAIDTAGVELLFMKIKASRLGRSQDALDSMLGQW